MRHNSFFQQSIQLKGGLNENLLKVSNTTLHAWRGFTYSDHINGTVQCTHLDTKTDGWAKHIVPLLMIPKCMQILYVQTIQKIYIGYSGNSNIMMNLLDERIAKYWLSRCQRNWKAKDAKFGRSWGRLYK